MKYLISIDGPTAAGKTTLAMSLAQEFGAVLLDTGLTYRGLAYVMEHDDIDPSTSDLQAILRHELLTSGLRTSGSPCFQRILYKGNDISEHIYGSSLDAALRLASTNPLWRAQILQIHLRLLRARDNAIVVGRDVAATLLLDASLHVFLNASDYIRRERRRAQYRSTEGRSTKVGPPSELDNSMETIIRKKPNGVVINTTFLPREAVRAAVLCALL